ncbi:MAG TPA: CPBP family intramembrane glutamic endopeptidase [Anaerolineales bacterium]|nr:CPBP family intramembrane glutamic endopeptidase [Anaerolineales bacterium]
MTISMEKPSPEVNMATDKGPAGAVAGPRTKVILSIIILACSLTVFLIAPKHAPLFPTNGNPIFAACVSAAFLLAAFLFKRSAKLSNFWPLAYAFFVASIYNLVADLAGGYEQSLLGWFGVSQGTNPGMGMGKVYEMLLAVVPFIALTLLSGADLRSIYLTKGNINYKWGFGIGALFLINYLTSVLMFYGTGYTLPKLGSAILWGLVFAFCNSILEELWVRGLFMKKLLPVVGVAGTVILTSTWFGLMHLLGVVYMPAFAIPVYVVNTITMGIACAIIMLKTDSIWGAFGLHAAADLFLFIAMLAVR